MLVSEKGAPAPDAVGTKARILLWHWGRHGGGPRYTLEAARALEARGDVDLYLSLSRQADIYREFDLPASRRFDIDTYTGYVSALASSPFLGRVRARFLHFLRENHIDTVVCTMAHIWNNAVLSAVRASGASYVLVVHDATPHPGEVFPRIPERLLAREMQRADRLVALSGHVRDEICTHHHIAPGRIRVMPHGMLTTGFETVEPRGTPADRALRLLCFGRIREYKGIDLLLEAFAHARAQVPELRLKLVGEGSLGPLARRARDLGVTVDNRYVPEDEVASVLAEADVMVLPYRESSQSGVAMLAYGAGMPVIATPVGGLKEQVLDRQTGLLARETSASALARCIVELSGDPALYDACSLGASLARAAGNWSDTAAGIVELSRTLTLETEQRAVATGASPAPSRRSAAQP